MKFEHFAKVNVLKLFRYAFVQACVDRKHEFVVGGERPTLDVDDFAPYGCRLYMSVSVLCTERKEFLFDPIDFAKLL